MKGRYSAARVDSNQREVIKAFIDEGASVQLLHQVGGGCPDLLVGYAGYNYLVEVKDGCKPPSKRQLTEDQLDWWGNWQGQVMIIKSVEEAKEMLSTARQVAEALAKVDPENLTDKQRAVLAELRRSREGKAA